MSWVRRLFARNRMESDLNKELRFHFESQVADKMRSGISESEARRLTRIEFGGMEQVKEDCREIRGTIWLESIVQDVCFGARRLVRDPGFTVVAVLTLTLGIGATTAIFTLVNALLLRSLPVRSPAQLWRIGDNEQCCNNAGLPTTTDGGIPNDWSLFSYEQYKEFRDHTPGFETLAAFESNDPALAVRREGSGQPAQPMHAE